jgi:hypothetical protein
MRAFVLTVDQVKSRTLPDLVPDAQRSLVPLSWLAPPVRTAGDEFQAATVDPTTCAQAIGLLLRSGAWSVGVGLDEFQPSGSSDARELGGPAFIAARSAVQLAKRTTPPLRVVGANPYACRRLENAAHVYAALVSRRTKKGWEVADLVNQGLTYEQISESLSISPSAVSQRAQSAAISEGLRAQELLVDAAQLGLIA